MFTVNKFCPLLKGSSPCPAPRCREHRALLQPRADFNSLKNKRHFQYGKKTWSKRGNLGKRASWRAGPLYGRRAPQRKGMLDVVLTFSCFAAKRSCEPLAGEKGGEGRGNGRGTGRAKGGEERRGERRGEGKGAGEGREFPPQRRPAAPLPSEPRCPSPAGRARTEPGPARPRSPPGGPRDPRPPPRPVRVGEAVSPC